METTELIKIIGCGEDSRTQFKREPIGARKLAEEMVAFSNSGGGTILFGVDDDGQVPGLTEADVRELNSQSAMPPTTRYVRPSIREPKSIGSAKTTAGACSADS